MDTRQFPFAASQQDTMATSHNYGSVAPTQGVTCETSSPVNKIRPINIQPLSKGFMVQVGCQTVAIETKEKLVKKLTAYIMEPADTETLYNNNEFL